MRTSAAWRHTGEFKRAKRAAATSPTNGESPAGSEGVSAGGSRATTFTAAGKRARTLGVPARYQTPSPAFVPKLFSSVCYVNAAGANETWREVNGVEL